MLGVVCVQRDPCVDLHYCAGARCLENKCKDVFCRRGVCASIFYIGRFTEPVIFWDIRPVGWNFYASVECVTNPGP